MRRRRESPVAWATSRVRPWGTRLERERRWEARAGKGKERTRRAKGEGGELLEEREREQTDGREDERRTSTGFWEDGGVLPVSPVMTQNEKKKWESQNERTKREGRKGASSTILLVLRTHMLSHSVSGFLVLGSPGSMLSSMCSNT